VSTKEWNEKCQVLLLPPDDFQTMIAQRPIVPATLSDSDEATKKKFVLCVAKYLYNYLRDQGLTLTHEEFEEQAVNEKVFSNFLLFPCGIDASSWNLSEPITGAKGQIR
jgi:hypothetical protein